MGDASRVVQAAKDLIREPDASSMADAVQALRGGGLVAFPTETVYGLGADARNEEAVASIFRAKGRPSYNPLIIHVSDLEMAEQYGRFDDMAMALAGRFWPGPLTLVVPCRKEGPLSALVSANLETIAIRIPQSETARALLEAFGGPVAAPSANLSGRLSPTEAEHVEEMLGDRVSLILDGGACEKGLESTIVGWQGASPVLLRPGAISSEELESFLGVALGKSDSTPASPRDIQADVADFTPTSPGQLNSHYAPRAGLRLNAAKGREGELMLAFGPDAPKDVAGVNLSPTGDLAEAATNLYAYLHLLDDTGVDMIAVMPVPDKGLGRAINDRLARAAAPRPEIQGS